MGTVRNLNESKDLEEFSFFLFENEPGYIHAPLKDPTTGQYKSNHFFKWPEQKEEFFDHVKQYSGKYEVYLSPTMFKGESHTVDNVQGSHVAWVDFDGKPPSSETLKEHKIPEPSLRVQSSVPGHEHWYWKFEQFNSSVASIQRVTKSLAYLLEGDVGAWHAGHSLRPVGSINHKRNKVPTHILSITREQFTPKDFEHVPLKEDSYNLKILQELQTRSEVPHPGRTLAKYAWTSAERELIWRKPHLIKDRSAALVALAFACAEKGMDNSEIYTVLSWRDNALKKFSGRKDKDRYYVDIVNFVRQKKPYESVQDVETPAEGLKWYTFQDILNYKDTTEWVIPGILPRGGILYIVGRPATGKTTLALGMSTHFALGKKYLDWEVPKPLKTMFLSLEMSPNDLQDFYGKHKRNFNHGEISRLSECFLTYASPEKIKLYRTTSPLLGKLLRDIETERPDIILVDSAAYALASNLKNEEEVTRSIEILSRICDKFGVTFIFIHHARKDPPNTGYKEADLDDMFGSVFIAASAAAVISLKQSKEYSDSNRLMDIKYLKSRFSATNAGFSVKMDGERRIFERPSIGELTASVPVVKPKAKPKDKDGKSPFDF